MKYNIKQSGKLETKLQMKKNNDILFISTGVKETNG